MIIFFGPPGAGKSVQGQLLALRHDWRWLSAGQLLRDSRDSASLEQMRGGGLVDSHHVNRVVKQALQRATDVGQLILDGFPRQLDQAEWLVKTLPEHQRAINLAIVLEVPRHELERRLALRGRLDDTPPAIKERLALYDREIGPIIDYFTAQAITICRIDGDGSLEQVQDRIEKALQQCSLV